MITTKYPVACATIARIRVENLYALLLRQVDQTTMMKAEISLHASFRNGTQMIISNHLPRAVPTATEAIFGHKSIREMHSLAELKIVRECITRKRSETRNSPTSNVTNLANAIVAI